MERLNSAGLKIIEYKQEFDRNPSDIVRGALLTSLELLVQQNIITTDAFESIKNGDSEESLRKVLLKNPLYKKSPKEMYKEYKKLDEKFIDALKEQQIGGFYETEISVEDNRISVLRQYSLDKDFIMLYFGIKEIDLIQLMKKRGFAEKFSVLRINKVFDEILSEQKEEENITQGKSLVYYNPEITGFSVDYFYHVDIDVLEMTQNIPLIAKKISELYRSVDTRFRRKTGIEFYINKPLRLKKQAEKAQQNNGDSENSSKSPKTPHQNGKNPQIPPNEHVIPEAGNIEDVVKTPPQKENNKEKDAVSKDNTKKDNPKKDNVKKETAQKSNNDSSFADDAI